MSNYQVVSSITENLRQLLQGEGIKFSAKVFEDESAIPMSLIPFGRILYKGESFEHSYGMKPGYVDAEFLTTVTLKGNDDASLMDEAQLWTHRLREAVTVSAVNVGGLSASKPVTQAAISKVDVKRDGELISLSGVVTLRYREG
ncbi:MAG: hypothetical protein KAS88_00400 [Deltaproteobacteria bacterium]|nr:hypothetical protein [Deltaproteobacteria bacterium]